MAANAEPEPEFRELGVPEWEPDPNEENEAREMVADNEEELGVLEKDIEDNDGTLITEPDVLAPEGVVTIEKEPHGLDLGAGTDTERVSGAWEASDIELKPGTSSEPPGGGRGGVPLEVTGVESALVGLVVESAASASSPGDSAAFIVRS